MLKILELSIKDFLSKKYILLNLIPFVVVFIITFIFIDFESNSILNWLNVYIKNISVFNEYPFFYSLIKNLLDSLFFAGKFFMVIILSIILTSIVISCLTSIVTKDISKKYYDFKKDNEISILDIILISFFTFIKFLFILLICLPLLFVPIINIFILNIPFFYAFYKFFLIDVASSALNKQEFNKFYKSGGGFNFIFACFCFYCISLIPILGVVLQLFFVIFLTHITYDRIKYIN